MLWPSRWPRKCRTICCLHGLAWPYHGHAMAVAAPENSESVHMRGLVVVVAAPERSDKFRFHGFERPCRGHAVAMAAPERVWRSDVEGERSTPTSWPRRSILSAPPPGGVVAQPCVAVLWPRSPWKGRTMFAPTAWHGRAVAMPWPYPPRKFRNVATSGAGLGQFLGRVGPLSWLGLERNTGPREDTSGGPRSLSTNPPPPL